MWNDVDIWRHDLSEIDMKTHELAKWLGLSPNTIRVWTREEFKTYLSPSAQGGDGRYRNFDEQDARVVAFIASLKQENIPIKEIHMTLTQMQEDDWEDLPPMPSAPPGEGPVSMMPREAAERAIDTQKNTLMRQIAVMEDKVEDLTVQLREEREQHQQERQQLQSDLVETREHLGELKGQLAAVSTQQEIVNQERTRERQLLMRGLTILAVVGLVLLIALVALAVASILGVGG